MNNEPVAWMNPKSLECGYGGEVDWEDTGCIPLYTHPAKTLTDEEIVSLINKHIDYVPDGDGMKVVGVMDLCRAILKKASEK